MLAFFLMGSCGFPQLPMLLFMLLTEAGLNYEKKVWWINTRKKKKRFDGGI